MKYHSMQLHCPNCFTVVAKFAWLDDHSISSLRRNVPKTNEDCSYCKSSIWKEVFEVQGKAYTPDGIVDLVKLEESLSSN